MSKPENISLFSAITILEAQAFNMEAECYNPHIDEDKKRINRHALKSIDKALKILKTEQDKSK